MMINETLGKKQRNSTFELLRIIAITFVFCHHSLLSLDLVQYWGGEVANDNPEKIIGIVLNSLFVIGVNLFILISGYFGINFKVSKLINILLLVLFCTLFEAFFASEERIRSIIYQIIHLYSKNPFVPSYVALFLISPLLRRGLKGLSFSELKSFMVLATIMNVFLGFILNYACVSENGYNLVNFIYLYILGDFLRRLPPIKTNILLLIYSGAYCVLIIWAYFYKSGFSAFAYNNPFVLILTSAFFLIFSKLKLNNSLINRIATAVFGIFLIEPLVKRYIFPINSDLAWWSLLLNLLGGYIIAFILSYGITIMVNRLFRYIYPYFKKVDNYFYFK